MAKQRAVFLPSRATLFSLTKPALNCRFLYLLEKICALDQQSNPVWYSKMKISLSFEYLKGISNSVEFYRGCHSYLCSSRLRFLPAPSSQHLLSSCSCYTNISQVRRRYQSANFGRLAFLSTHMLKPFLLHYWSCFLKCQLAGLPWLYCSNVFLSTTASCST